MAHRVPGHREQERLAFQREEPKGVIAVTEAVLDVAQQGDLADVRARSLLETRSPPRVISTLPSTIT